MVTASTRKPAFAAKNDVAIAREALRKAEKRAAKIEEAERLADDYHRCREIEAVNGGRCAEDLTKAKRVAYQFLHGCMSIDTLERINELLMADMTNPMNQGPEDDEETLAALGLG